MLLGMWYDGSASWWLLCLLCLRMLYNGRKGRSIIHLNSSQCVVPTLSTTHKSPRWWWRPLLFERELVGEVGEENKRCRSAYPSLTNRPLLSIFTGQLQLNGHQYTARAVHPSYPQLLCFSDYGLLLPPLLRLGLHQVYGMKQPAGKPAPALLRILFLILAWLLFLLFRNGWLHLGGVSGRHRALWGRRKRGLGGKQGRRVTSGGKECDRKKVRWVIRDERWG